VEPFRFVYGTLGFAKPTLGNAGLHFKALAKNLQN